MSVLNDYDKIEIADFRGPNLLVEPTDVKPPWGLSATNVEYEPGSFRTRFGYYPQAAGLPTSGLVSGAFNYIRGSASRLIWAVGFNSVSGNVDFYIADSYNSGTAYGPFFYTSQPVPGGASFAQYGKFVYIGTYSATGWVGSQNLAIVDMEAGPAFSYSGGFNRPRFGPSAGVNQEIAISTAYSAGGSITPGTRVVAVLFQDSTGFVTRPSPVQNASGYPTDYFSTTTASTGQKVTITVTPVTFNWPTDYVKAYLLVTTVTNQSRLLYADVAPVTVPAGTATPITFILTSPDVVLAEQPDIGDQESVMVNDSFGNGPIFPSFVFPCGSRMGYLAYSGGSIEANTYQVIISDPEDPQRMTPDGHVLTLPQQRQGVCAFYFQSTLYVFGPSWTYAKSDTGDLPSLWPPWTTVDDKLGTSHPYGISIDATGFGFVAHRSGLYAFSGGQYARLPISYYHSPLWKLINWDSLAFTIVIDSERYKVAVFCTLLDGTSEMWTWDYTEGYGPDEAKFSRHVVTGGGASARWGLIVLNRGDANFAGQRSQLWIARNSDSVWLLNHGEQDSNRYTDGSANIPTTYDMAYLPPGQREALIHEHHALELRALGVGSLVTRAYKLDRTLSQLLANSALSTTPAQEYTRFLDLRSEGISYRFQNTGTAGDWIQVSTVRHYHLPYMKQR